MLLSSAERRCLQIFKAFAEKALLPQIKQANGSLTEWSIFQSLISAPNPNLNQIQYFVDSLQSGPNPNANPPKPPLSKKQQQIEQIAKEIFQLNKTFGGQKNRSSVANLIEQNANHARRESNFDEIQRQQRSQNSSGIMSGLEKMLRSFQENQAVLDSMSQGQGEHSHTKGARSVLNQLSYNGGSNGNSPTIYSTQGNILMGSQSKPLFNGYLRPSS